MTREEIVRAFRDAQETINALAALSGNDFSKYQPFSDRAAQVEQMRCETCANDGIVSVDETASALVAIRCPWRGCGGCFQHKPKISTMQRNREGI